MQFSWCWFLGLLAATTSLITCGGGNGEPTAGRVEIHDSAGITLVSNLVPDHLPIWRVARQPTLVLGDDDGPDGHPLFRVTGATRLTDGSVAVANSGASEVLIFDEAGSLSRVLGGRGGGPGEFSGVALMMIPSEELIVVEDVGGFQRRLTTFEMSGDVFSTQSLGPPTLPVTGFWSEPVTSPDGVVFALGEPMATPAERGPEPDRAEGWLVRFTYHGEGPDTLAAYPGSEYMAADVGPRPAVGGGSASGPRLIAPLYRAGSAVAGGGEPWRVAAGDQAIARIDVYDSHGRLLRRISWAADGRPISRASLDFARRRYLESPDSRRDPRGAQRSLDVMPTPVRTPVFARILVDRGGNFWVQRYPLPDDQVIEWWVFDDEGRMVAIATIPPGLTILEAGTEHLLILAHGELDVERVEVRLLHR